VDHLPAVAQTVTELWALGVVPPLEELLRDTLDTPLVGRLLALLPVLLDPSAAFATTLFPAGVAPLSWDTIVPLLPALLGPGEDGPAPVEALHPLLVEILPSDALWVLVERAGVLLDDPEASIRGALDGLPAVLDADPYLVARMDIAAALDDLGPLRWAMIVAERPELAVAITGPAPDGPGPLPTLTAWVAGGTLETLLSTLQALSTLAPEPA
jgi:hypothetical protein